MDPVSVNYTALVLFRSSIPFHIPEVTEIKNDMFSLHIEMYENNKYSSTKYTSYILQIQYSY